MKLKKTPMSECSCVMNIVNKWNTLLALSLFCAQSTAWGAPDTWTGATSNNMNVGTNWSTASPPNIGDDVTFPSTATNNTPQNRALNVNSVLFSGPNPVTWLINSGASSITGTGVTNSSAVNQNIQFNSGTDSLTLSGTASARTAGSTGSVTYGSAGATRNGTLNLTGNSTLDGATISTLSALNFSNSASATNANVVIAGDNSSFITTFNDSSSAGSSTFTLNTGGTGLRRINFNPSTTLSSATFNLNGSGSNVIDVKGNPANATFNLTSPSAGLVMENANFIGTTISATAGSMGQNGTPILFGTLSGNIAATMSFGGAWFQFGLNNTSGLITGDIQGIASGFIEKDGTGSLTLTGNKTYLGGTFVAGGTLNLNGALVGPNAGGVLVFSSATLNIQANNNALTALSSQSGSLITLSSNTITIGNNNASGTIAGNVTGTASAIINKIGTGSQTFTSAISYLGSINVNGGSLVLSGSGALASSTVNLGASGVMLDISGITSATTIGNLTGVSGSQVTLGAKTLALGTSNSTSFNGVISGTGGALTKQGSGTFTLTGANTYTGGTTISAGTLALSGSGLISSTGTVNLSASGATFDISAITPTGMTIGDLSGVSGSQVALGAKALTVGTSNTTSFAGIISGTGGALVKQGSGTFTLAGANTYTGGTTINAGTLSISSNGNLGNAAGPLSMGSATLETTASFTATRSTTLVGAATFLVDPSVITTWNGVISGVGGSLTKTGSGTLILGGANSYDAGTTISAGTLALSGSGSLSSTGTVNLSASGATFDISATTGGATIGDLLGASGSQVTLGAKTLALGTSNSTSFNGVISGTGGALTKQGSGTFTLTGANTYTGGTTISAGTLALSGSGSLSSTGTVNLSASGATFDISATAGGATIGDLLGVSGSQVTLGSNTLTFGTSNSTSFNGVISGIGGALTKQGSGTFTLTTANPYTGGTTISAGTLALSGSGSLSSTGTVNLSASGTIFDMSGASGLTIGDLLGTSGSQVTLGSNTLTFGTSNSTSFNGVISGIGGALTKQGSGTFTLTGANTYTGGTMISAGTLALSGSGSLSSTGTVNLSGSGTIFDMSGASGLTIGDLLGASGSQVTLGSNTLTLGTSNSTSFNGVISGIGGALTKQGSGTFTLTGANTYTGGTTISVGTLALSGSGSLSSTGTVNLSASGATFDISSITPTGTTLGDLSGVSNSYIALGSKTLIVGTSNTTSFAGIISGIGGAVVKQGSGTFTLTGANTYTGGTTISAGTLALSGSGSLSSIGAVNLSASGATFDISATSGVTIGDLIGSSNSQVILGSQPLTTGTSASTTFAGVITGMGGSLIKQGTGTLTLTGANSYTGGTTISAGALQGDTSSLQGNILNNGAVIFDQSGAGTYNGLISGSGSLTKIGAGELIVPGANTYLGPTQINAGTFVIDGSLASPVTVGSGATLKGSGTINANVVVNGFINPGDAIGALTVGGNITFNNGSNFQAEFNPTQADLLKVTGSGNITISPGSTLIVTPTPATYEVNTVYQIATAGDLGGQVIGTFDTVINTYPLIQAHVIYGSSTPSILTDLSLASPTQIDLILNFLPLSSEITSGNPGAIAASLDGVNPPIGSDLYFVFQQLYFLPTTEQLRAAFDQMQPSILKGATLTQQNNSFLVSSSLQKRTSDLYESRCPCNQRRPLRRWHLWGDYSFGSAQQSNQSQNVGFHSSTKLGTMGIDYAVTRHVYVGALGAHTHSSVGWKHHLAKATISSSYGGLYSSYLNSHFFVNLSALGTFNHYRTKRSVSFGQIHRQPQGTHEGHGILGHLDAGMIFPRRGAFKCYPYGQLDYLYLHEKGYQEKHAQSLDLIVRGKTSTILRSELGLKGRFCASTKKGSFIPHGKLAWVRESRFQGRSLDAHLIDVDNLFTVKGIYPSRNLAAIGVGLTAVMPGDWAHLSMTYEGLRGSKVQQDDLHFTLILEF